MWLRGGGLSGCLVLKLVAWMLIFEITVIIVTVTFLSCSLILFYYQNLVVMFDLNAKFNIV